MRIWDLDPKYLCRQHLLAEHRELHGLWNILTIHQGRGGYSRHPETLRWVGKTRALYERHEALVKEFARRGYKHHSPLDKRLAKGQSRQTAYLNTIAEQKVILKKKPCACLLHTKKSAAG
ncbi:MAG: pyrimidine dimer DNA glycosylase/endonuclease V [Patescibacteria group bacterium]